MAEAPDIVQRTLGRAYDRFGPRVLLIATPVVLAVGMVTIALTLAWAGRYLRLRFDQLWPAFLIGAPGAAAMFLLAAYSAPDDTATLASNPSQGNPPWRK